MKSIIIYEPFFSGHHLHNLNFVINLFFKNNWNVFLITLKANNISHIDKRDNITLIYIDKYKLLYSFNKVIQKSKFLNIIFNRYLFQIYHWIQIKLILSNDKNKFQYIFIPFIEYIDLLSAVFKRLPFKSIKFICFGASFKKTHLNFYKINRRNNVLNFLDHLLFKRLIHIKNLLKYYSNDELFYKYILQKIPTSNSKIRKMPEFELFHNPQKIKKNILKNISLSKYVFLIFGSISKKKSAVEFLEYLDKSDIKNNITLIIAGKISPDYYELKTYLRKHQHNFKKNQLLIYDQFISDKFQRELFSLSNFTWIGGNLSEFTLSGVLALSIMYGNPVITLKDRYPGYITNRYKLGTTISNLTFESIDEAMKKLINKRSSYINSIKKYKENLVKKNIEAYKVLKSDLKKL